MNLNNNYYSKLSNAGDKIPTAPRTIKDPILRNGGDFNKRKAPAIKAAWNTEPFQALIRNGKVISIARG